MFIDVTEEIIPILEKSEVDNLPVKIYRSDIVRVGCPENAQFLRKYKDGSWKLELRAGFIRYEIPLQEHQALDIIEQRKHNGYFNTVSCVVVVSQSDQVQFEED